MGSEWQGHVGIALLGLAADKCGSGCRERWQGIVVVVVVVVEVAVVVVAVVPKPLPRACKTSTTSSTSMWGVMRSCDPSWGGHKKKKQLMKESANIIQHIANSLHRGCRNDLLCLCRTQL